MADAVNNQVMDDVELREWLDSLDYVLQNESAEKATHLLEQLQIRAKESGVDLPYFLNTPYINTIPKEKQAAFPGNRDIERRIKSIVRWNAMAMVVRANKNFDGLGGHISTFASSATLYEVGFNHFFRAPKDNHPGDFVYFQGHASPGIYARAFVEGRLDEKNLECFRRELQETQGLSSYPHPWLMDDFWQFPTVSMGLGPIMSIYQARFNEYLKDRGLIEPNDGKVIAFLGDGECDEPESLGALTVASREKLDNLIFVVNCNLQRLDGPVRGNGKIIQELEALFRGAGWNVIKTLWGSDWDAILDKDVDGKLAKRMNDAVDGEYQKYTVSDGAYVRENFFNSPELQEMVKHLSDEQIQKIRRGGHDPQKVYAAFKAAYEHKGQPTVILAKTIKGYGLGEVGEGKNATHQQKKLNEDELREFRSRFHIPISDEEVAEAPFYRPAEDSEEMVYLREHREALGGSLPQRRTENEPLKTPDESVMEEFYAGTEGREVSTTMAYVRILSKLLRDKDIGKLIVPIIPDEARTFGMDGLFRQCGIYAHAGQLYEPVDSESLMYYKESQDGQILEEGINEAGAISSFIAAGTAYSTQGQNTIPFYTYYSMFGPQRVGDLIWAAADLRCRGFLIGGTAGRTTLNGEGLQHQDGHSHLMLSTVPTMRAYDPSFAYEIATIIRHGIWQMYEKQDSVFYYLSVSNENYAMPAMPEGVKDGIIKGAYKFKASEKKADLKAHLLGSGAIMTQVLKAQEILEKDYNVSTDIWSVTSYTELRRDALMVDRDNLLNAEHKQQTPYVTELFNNESGVIVAASDYMKVLPDGIRQWMPLPFSALGTDGFGRSETREALRDFFEVDEKHIVWATLVTLFRDGKIKQDALKQAKTKLGINPDKLNPMIS